MTHSADSRLPRFVETGSDVARNPSFSLYRSSVDQWLEKRSMRHRSPEVRALNLPFEIKANPDAPYRGRYLLFHGLNDSPYVWQPLASELAKRGFDVRAILFDGHGSSPQDMLDVRWEWWLESAREHLAFWREDNVPMFLGGFSMGAVIATWLALDNPEIDGLLLISPAFKSRLNRYLRWSGLYARFRPWVFGGMIREDNPIKYNSVPVNSGWQYFQLTQGLKRRWSRKDHLDMPALMVMTEDDSVVSAAYTKKLFTRRFTASGSRLLSYSADPMGFAALKASDGDERMVYRSSFFPEKRILNQSHLGLMYPPDNVLFGERSEILVCNGNEYAVFSACVGSSRHWYGAQHTPSPDDVPVARTTYNADWHAMLELMDEVLLATP
ncbi:MAG: alpha/beta hydrolase [Granulosicoccus sp.]